MVKEDLFLLTLKLYLKNNFMKDLTVVIVTYRTPKKIITNCIRSIQKNVKILIIENSSNFEHNSLLKKFPNLKILCTGKNLGYGKGNNFGLVSIKTKYVLILNPDIVCEKNLFKSISSVIRKKINFHIIGCQYLKDIVFMPAGYFDYKKNEDFKKTLISKIPSGTLGNPIDIANCALFLASEMSEYINGETIHVNGGMYMA